MARSLKERGGFNPPSVTSNDGTQTKKIASRKIRISEERQLVLEIVNTVTTTAAQLLLRKLQSRFEKTRD